MHCGSDSSLQQLQRCHFSRSTQQIYVFIPQPPNSQAEIGIIMHDLNDESKSKRFALDKGLSSYCVLGATPGKGVDEVRLPLKDKSKRARLNPGTALQSVPGKVNHVSASGWTENEPWISCLLLF
jgi:hypothetical protein